MKKFTAKTLQDALLNASEEFQCSVVDLEYEIVQNPSAGFLGLGKKDAIIVATTKASLRSCQDTPQESVQDFTRQERQSPQDLRPAQEPKPKQETQAKQTCQKADDKKAHDKEADKESQARPSVKESYEYDGIWGVENDFKDIAKEDLPPQPTKYSSHRAFRPPRENLLSKEEVLENIKTELKELLLCLPFDLDCVEVSLRNDNLLFIKIDGKDCALLIGEKGYRYKALLYLLINWINPKYGFTLRLEVAQFLSNQEQLIDSYLQSIIKLVQETSKAQTKPFDGVLAYIALGKLREVFPQKYVSFRTNENGEKYIIIDDFRRF